MKTAVEYLLHMYALQGAIYQYDIDKAIEIEKEQIMNAHFEGSEDYRRQYYNETFKKHEQ
jgi:hypothetical protein